MDAPPTPYQSADICFAEKEIIFNNIIHIMKIFYSSDHLKFTIEPKDIEYVDFYFEQIYGLKELYSLNEFFNQMDTIEKIVESLKKNETTIKQKMGVYAYNIFYSNSNMIVQINIFLSSGQVQYINVPVAQIKLDDKVIISKLKEYIRYIRQMPHFNDLLKKFEFVNKINKMSNILVKPVDLSFLQEALTVRLNGPNFKFRLVYSTKDGDSAKIFHQKCDKIGPNLSIVKSRDGYIFGGFTTQNWSGKDFKKDDLSFLFSYDHKKIYPIKQGDWAICPAPFFLINFFNSHAYSSTLRVNDNYLERETSGVGKIKKCAYNGFSYDHELNLGKQNFAPTFLEVYEFY